MGIVAQIEVLGLPQHGAQVSALFLTGTKSYTRKSALISGHYIDYSYAIAAAINELSPASKTVDSTCGSLLGSPHNAEQ